MTDIVERLRGRYRIPITDGLGPVGGEEPNNPNAFFRTFPTSPLANEAAAEIERLRTDIFKLLEALRPFADFADKSERPTPEHWQITRGPETVQRQLTMGDCYRAARVIKEVEGE